MHSLVSSLLAVLPLQAAPPVEAEYRGKGLTVELVSEVNAVRPGQPFYAGLFIRHDPKHHTYWKVPGLAGVATKLEWSLPEGWIAGEIEWPAPDKVKMANIDTHGYERDVLLMVKITPPAKIDSSAVDLKTKASWMCCGATCHPGYQDLAITLPLTAGAEPPWHKRWHKVFEKERASFPVPLTGWKLSAVRKDKKIILTGEPEEKGVAMPEKPVFFSSDNLICSNPPQTWTATPTGFRAELAVSDFPPKDQSVLRGLLSGKPGWRPNDPRAVSIEVPVK